MLLTGLNVEVSKIPYDPCYVLKDFQFLIGAKSGSGVGNLCPFSVYGKETYQMAQ